MDFKDEPFVMRNPLLLRLERVLLILGGVALFVLSLPVWGNPTARWSYSITLLVVTLVITGEAVLILRWEIKIIGQSIYCRFIRKTKSFTFDAITKATVDAQGDNLILYSEGKILVSINTMCDSYSIFATRLQEEGVEIVPYVKGGKA